MIFRVQDDSIKKDTTTLATPAVQHRLAGGGIAPEMLKDPNENERMERVKRYFALFFDRIYQKRSDG